MVLTLEFMDEMLQCDHSKKATKQYFPVVPLIKMVLTSGSVDEIVQCKHSNEST